MQSQSNERYLQLLFTGVVTACLLTLAIEALEFSIRARYFPLTMGALGTLAGVASIIKQIVVIIKNRDEADDNIDRESSSGPPARSSLLYFSIFLSFILLTYVAGIFVSTFVFIFSSQFFIARIGVIKSILSAAIMIALLYVMEVFMNMRWPTHLL